jgi:Xaa-Pro aminopeptidase
MERTGKIFRFLESQHLDCLVTNDENAIRYLTGFTGTDSILYADDNKAVLITDGRYIFPGPSGSQVLSGQGIYAAENADSIWQAVAAGSWCRREGGL